MKQDAGRPPLLGGMPLEAIILDFDGLMVDTETSSIRWWADKYAELGFELSMDLCRARVGRADSQWHPIRDLEQLLDRSFAAEEPVWRAEVIEVMQSQPLLPGVQALLDEARERGIRLAIASSVRRAMLERHLARLGLGEYIELSVTREDVERTKPAPDLYLLALERLGVAPDTAFALEDSLNGVRAAKAAGLKVIAVPSWLMLGEDFTLADASIESLEGQTPESLAALLRA